MDLSLFIKNLFETGEVKVAGALIDFTEPDLKTSLVFLKERYEQVIQEMPGTAPAFYREAALWAARYFYNGIQLAVIRDLGEEEVKATLTNFEGTVTAEAIFSVDLIFHYLPDLLHLSKGLAPDDVLVECLKSIAAQWPFSSARLDLERAIPEEEIKTILSDSSLKYAYIDRIIESKSEKKLNMMGLRELVQERLGEHQSLFWPELMEDFSQNDN